MFVGYIFAMNLFVGVVVDNFARIQKADEGSAIMTPEQEQWAATVRAMATSQPKRGARPPEGALRGRFFALAQSKAFDALITCVIVANVVVMACDSYELEHDARLKEAP